MRTSAISVTPWPRLARPRAGDRDARAVGSAHGVTVTVRVYGAEVPARLRDDERDGVRALRLVDVPRRELQVGRRASPGVAPAPRPGRDRAPGLARRLVRDGEAVVLLLARVRIQVELRRRQGEAGWCRLRRRRAGRARRRGRRDRRRGTRAGRRARRRGWIGVGLGEGDGVATGPGAVIIDATCDEERVIVWPPRIGARIGVRRVNGAWTRTVAM